MTVWDHKYCTDAARTNSTTKQRRVVELAQTEGLLDLRQVPFDADETWRDIARVHEPRYVNAVRTGRPRRLATSQGFRWSQAFAESVARIWTGHIAACTLALTESVVMHPVSGAHHADYDSGGGFCTFNFLVGAARHLLESGLKCVATIDFDAHPGDGTYKLTRNTPGVALFDIAGGSWVNVERGAFCEYHDVDDSTDYRAALLMLPDFLDRVKPDLVMYQAGVDPYMADPVGGIPGVDAEFLRYRDQFVIGHLLHRGIPVVVNLAGGYVENGISEHLHLETIRVAADTLSRQGTRELCSFDRETGTLTDEALHAELLGDDTTESDLDLTPCENMTDKEIDGYIEAHCRKHYGGNANRKPDGK